MGPPETEPPSNSTAPVLNFFYCHTGDIYFSDIYIALSKLIAKKKIYIYLKIFWQGLLSLEGPRLQPMLAYRIIRPLLHYSKFQNRIMEI